MGAIINYAVIVEKGHPNNKPEQGNLNITKLPTWYKCTKEKNCTKYQATPNSWNPFNVNESVKCKPVGDSNSCKINYTLGYDNRCKNNKIKDYCNGPLRPGLRYSIKIRGYTTSGFAETPPICTETEPEEAQKPKSGIIVAVVVSLLFLMLLATGFFIYKKFGIINRFFGKTVMETSTETNDISFMSVITKSRPVKLSSFASHVSAMMADSALRFSQEFEELKSISPSHSCSAAQMQENKLKNRWINILPFDHSRVKLLPMDDEPGSDYINASYIPVCIDDKGFNSHREYIATQGPLPNTVDDMWRMIWEHGISMIVMLTQCVERGKTKCEQYWPLDKEEATYGDLKVQTIHESILSDYIIRSFNVSLGEKQRVMTQMHFTKWPDFGCPENTELLINFVRTVRDRMIENDPNPMLVHCSTGVSRTGTFIAVDRLAKHIELYDVIDVFHIVLDMRQHRTNMVQTEDQYIYIHECVRDLIQEKFARNNESYKNVFMT
ncbi:tyrosine-protein phosphatase 10D-like [Centruroides sculpturatus]|uniref:tyrosine-protein phosphatase 10D-like n=1 Tax=Centruroides sculpturatus TaxID=218467 RepID=UPI000C6D4D6A|nr:tyrosine-protein phosphatase 10D-like [Centruroides sculpturatus]